MKISWDMEPRFIIELDAHSTQYETDLVLIDSLFDKQTHSFSRDCSKLYVQRRKKNYVANNHDKNP